MGKRLYEVTFSDGEKRKINADTEAQIRRVYKSRVKKVGLTPVQALGVALSVAAPTQAMHESQKKAPAMLAHLEAMGYTVVQLIEDYAKPNRSIYKSGLE